jgi:hypothetical protein
MLCETGLKYKGKLRAKQIRRLRLAPSSRVELKSGDDTPKLRTTWQWIDCGEMGRMNLIVRVGVHDGAGYGSKKL